MRVLLGFISCENSDAASGGACWLTFRDEVVSVYNVQLASEDFLGALRLEKNCRGEKENLCEVFSSGENQLGGSRRWPNGWTPDHHPASLAGAWQCRAPSILLLPSFLPSPIFYMDPSGINCFI